MAEVQKLKLINVISITLFHIVSFLALFYIILYANHLVRTVLFILLLGDISGFGVTAGVHRLWCHKAYKARTGFKICLALCYSMAGQNTIYDWVRDHRLHHKCSDTEADPHNAKKGFWYSHVTWLFYEKNSITKEKGRSINMKDILEDDVVIWHTKYFNTLKILFCFIIPTLLHRYVCTETWTVAILAQVFVRYCMSLNFTWLVNSAAHIWGTRPYNKNILPAQNLLVSLLAIGEGWHNYHHMFPYDYKADELGNKLNITTFFLNLASKFGWIYDLREPNKNTVIRYLQNNENVDSS